LTWNEWVISYDFAHQVVLAQNLQRGSRSWGDAFRGEVDRFRRSSVRVIKSWQFRHQALAFVVPVGLLAFLALARLGALGRWRRQLRLFWLLRGKTRSAEPQLASVLYGELMRQLARYGFQRGESETPLEFAAAVSEPAVAPAVREFTRIYSETRFGGAMCDVTRLRALLGQIRGALRSR